VWFGGLVIFFTDSGNPDCPGGNCRAAVQQRYRDARAIYAQRLVDAGGAQPPPPPQPPPVCNSSDPHSIFTSQSPNLYENDGAYELGTRFSADKAGQITKVRLFTHPSEGGTHKVRLWNANTGQLVAGPLDWNVSGVGGWKELALPLPPLLGWEPWHIAANTQYIIAISNGPDRYYAEGVGGFNAPINNCNLHTFVGSGVYSDVLGSMPTSVWNNTNYFRDIVFDPD